MGLGDDPTMVLRVVIRCPDVATFVSKYSRFIKDDRIFIFTKSSQKAGTRVRFSLELADGRPLLSGDGTVVRTRPDTGDPGRPPGMELKFVPLDEFSREMVDKILQVRSLSAAAGGTFSGPAPSLPPPLPPAPRGPRVEPRLDSPRINDEPAPALAPLSSPHASQTDSQEIMTEVRAKDLGSPLPRRAPPPSGAWSTETPLPAPAPAATLQSPPHGMPIEPDGEPAPVFAEAQAGTVPANPFSEISDNAIEYFVEWGIEQSTKAKPQPGSFADISMRPPVAEGRVPRAAWLGLAAGLGIGTPLGALGLWALTAGGTQPSRATSGAASAAAASSLATPVAGEAPALAPDAPQATGAPLGLAGPGAPPRLAAPASAPSPGAAAVPGPDGDELPAAPPMTLHPHKHMAFMRIRSTPPGCDVIVKGQARGKTPLEVELPSGHRYDVEVLLPGGKWKRRVNLAPPSTDIHASLTKRPH